MSGENDQSEREKERVEERAWEQQKRAEDLAWEKEKRKKDRAWEHAIRRDGMAAHGLKAVLLLNGGGAVALLAFLQAIWSETTAENLVPWVARPRGAVQTTVRNISSPGPEHAAQVPNTSPN